MGVPKPTEMTIRDLLQEELRKRGAIIVPEFLSSRLQAVKSRLVARLLTSGLID